MFFTPWSDSQSSSAFGPCLPYMGMASFHVARPRARNKRHRDRNFDLQYIHAVLRLAEFFHAASHNLGFLFCEFQALFVDSLLVSYKFQKEGHVRGDALRSDALNPG